MSRKVLYLDIETSPMDVKTWGVWDQNALRVDEEWVILGAAYAWDDGPVKAVYPRKVTDWKENRTEREAAVLASLWELLDEADLVVAHNGDKFDLRKINARPPSPYISLDTLKEAKKHFGFTYNRLDYLGRFLGVGGKLDHTGLDLWMDCVEGSAPAWRLMKQYNVQDVALLRDVYKRMRPWMANHPALHDQDCPTCGSPDRQKRGTRDTKMGTRYQQYSCNNCGRFYREATREGAPEYRP